MAQMPHPYLSMAGFCRSVEAQQQVTQTAPRFQAQLSFAKIRHPVDVFCIAPSRIFCTLPNTNQSSFWPLPYRGRTHSKSSRLPLCNMQPLDRFTRYVLLYSRRRALAIY